MDIAQAVRVHRWRIAAVVAILFALDTLGPIVLIFVAVWAIRQGVDWLRRRTLAHAS